MTLQNLSKILDKYDKRHELGTTEAQQFRRLKALPFYNFLNHNDIKTFNHIIGLPTKGGLEFSLFDYEHLLYNTLQKHKHLWIKKATGLGITEFMLRFMVWLCIHDDSLRGSQMCIVTGPRIELAITLIDRMKGLFRNQNQQKLASVSFDRLSSN